MLSRIQSYNAESFALTFIANMSVGRHECYDWPAIRRSVVSQLPRFNIAFDSRRKSLLYAHIF